MLQFTFFFYQELAASVSKTKKSLLSFHEAPTEGCFEGLLGCVATNKMKFKIHTWRKMDGALTNELHNTKTHKRTLIMHLCEFWLQSLKHISKHTLHKCPRLLGWTYSRAVKFNLLSTSKSGPVSLKKKGKKRANRLKSGHNQNKSLETFPRKEITNIYNTSIDL